MHFIPYSRQVLVEKCCNDSSLSKQQSLQFRSFSEILNSYIHFVSQKNLEQMKQAYAYFNPNQESSLFTELTDEEKIHQANILAETFSNTLNDAKFNELAQKDIEKAFTAFSLVPVNTDVDLNSYQRIKLFYRGSSSKEVTVKRFFRNRQIQFENYDRVAVLLHINEQHYFDAQETDTDDLNFTPGKVYLYLYKNIPHYDLELLFPNVKISMNLKDKLMLVIPALGAAIPMTIKVLPSIGLLIGAIALVMFGWDLGGRFDVDVSNSKAVYPLLVAILSTTLALGGFAVRQYIKYKSKRLEFLKRVTDVLFFKSLDVCKGVITAVIDMAEEEKSKEALLVYTQLLKQPCTKSEIQLKVNNWVKSEFSVDVGFNVERALQQLQGFQAPDKDHYKRALIEQLPNGCYQACDIESAKYIMDYIWDHAFHYANN